MASNSSNGHFFTEDQLHSEIMAAREHGYFVITLTNYPNLLQRTQQYQQYPHDHRQQQQHRPRSVLMSNGPTHPAILHCEEHERYLYAELRYDLQQVVQAYFQRTRQSFPISLVFDLSNIQR